jgi:ethylene-responsive transcription factor 1
VWLGTFEFPKVAALSYNQVYFSKCGVVAVLNFPVERVRESLVA